MIVPMQFYGGYPADGVISSGTTNECHVFDLNAGVPQSKRWRIEEITVCNMTSVTGLYTVAVFPGTYSNNPQTDMGAVSTATPPHSTRAALDGNALFEPTKHRYLAYTQSINPRTTRTMPIVAWANGLEKLWAGVHPGFAPDFSPDGVEGYGGICLTISGREYGP